MIFETMKKLLLLLTFLGQFGAQATNLDSLFNSIAYRSSSLQLNVLDSAYKSMRRSDSLEFIAFHKRAMQVNLDWKDKKELLYTAKYSQAKWFFYHDQEAKGILILSSLTEQINVNEYPELKAHVHISLSSNYNEIGSPEKALEQALLALDCMQFAQDSAFLPVIYNSIGEDYRTLKDFNAAIDYYDLGLSVAINQNDSFHTGKISNNKGIALTQLDQFDEAKAVLLFGYETARKTGDKFGQAILLTNLGFNAKEKGEYQEALEYYTRSIALKEALGNQRSIAYTLNDMGETYFLLGKHDLAIRYSLKALRMLDEKYSPYYAKDFKLTLARAYKGNEQYDSAFFYLDASSQLQESLLNEDKLKEVARIEQLSVLREKDLENKMLKAQNEASLSELKQGQWLFAFVALLCITAIFIGFILYRNSRLKNAFSKQLEAQNLALTHSNENLNQLLNEQNSLFNIVTHDLKGPLVNSAQLLELESESKTSEEKAKLRTMITRSVNGALGFISEFNALRELEEKHEIPQNQIFDLTAIINEVLGHFQSEMESRKIEVHFNTSQKIELNSVPSFVRHIMLNLISNAVKYSPDKGSIFITISQSDNTRISIEDQGMGIKPENLDRIFERFFRAPAGLVSAKSNGLGLSLVKLLVEKLNGKITVKSTLNKGSEFIVSIP